MAAIWQNKRNKQQSTDTWCQREGVRWRGGEAGAESAGGRSIVALVDKLIDGKNRETDGPLALDGRRLMGGYNNQPKVGIDNGRGVGEETLPGQKVCGGVVSWRQIEQEKNRK